MDTLDTPPWHTHAQTPTRTSPMIHPLAKTLAEAMRGGNGDGSSSSSWETAFGHLHVTADTSRSGETAIHGVCTCVCACVCVRARERERDSSWASARHGLHVTFWRDCTARSAYVCVSVCGAGKQKETGVT